MTVVRYVCGQCKVDEKMTFDQTTEHWEQCIKPLLEL